MPIGQINFATIQRTSDVDMYRQHQDSKMLMDQQNIQGQIKQRDDAMSHQVLDSQDSNKADNKADARDEGKNKYSKRKGDQKKKKPQQDGQGVVKKQAAGFDIRI
jgi:hypothetical protein